MDPHCAMDPHLEAQSNFFFFSAATGTRTKAATTVGIPALCTVLGLIKAALLLNSF
jgi:hypothetical protein